MKNKSLSPIGAAASTMSLALWLLVASITPGVAQTKPAAGAAATPVSLNRILIFSKTKGYRHGSIPAGIRLLTQLGRENGFAVDTTEDATKFNEANLKRYGAVVWMSTTGDVLDDVQQAQFQRYIQAGGGYVGVHAATDCEYNWPWYNKLAGAQFASHPGRPNVQWGETDVVTRNHPSMVGFPDRWKVKDEFYDFKNMNMAVNVLLKIDEKTYKDGKMGDNHPMAWYHDFDGGKAFYTNFGHNDSTYLDPVFQKHLLAGLKSVMATGLKFGQAKTQPFPEENRFDKHVLATGLDEPTELAVLPGGKVLFAERKGKVKMYDLNKKAVKVVATVPVHFQREYGLMGLNIDPNFAQNKWVYLYYSPVAPDTNQRLVRVKYDDVRDTLLLNTEQLVLQVPVDRIGGQDDCCHTGGSIAWDRQGNLYLSTGDDSNPFASKGFSPSDDRPGRTKWTALRSSANTNDLRGKIIRIKPKAEVANGRVVYDIPEGNLFPKGTPNARPEIYTMGHRNPYRIAVDQRTGFVYWGEVGPDAGENDPRFGPRGHDEMNQARKAGNFGWPLFVADNKPYRQFNFADSTSGPLNDPAHPINYSRLNTGLRELPAAQKAFIYYPYADSPEFGPIIGKGGRNAMGGPVYYYDDYPETAVKFPRHYDGKFFAYEWMRDWIHPVTMTPEGDFVQMETFMPGTKFSHPMDMQFAADGSLYVLEYGQNWFAQNDDAVLARITYNAGNRRPVAMATASQTVGAAPMAVSFSANGSMDYDGDALKYEWTFAPGVAKSSATNANYTFTKPGVYHPVLTVTDAKGNVATKELTIRVGNAAPKVEIAMKGNRSFYFPNKPVTYSVSVADKEDGSLANGKITPDEVTMTINYLEGFDKTALAQGHQMNTSFAEGKRLIELSDCKACHGINQKSVGPAYIDVAKKYKGRGRALLMLTDKVIKGGGGVWGEQAMSAHPQLTKDEAGSMVQYILSLADEKPKQPLAGDYMPAGQAKDGAYVLSASYTDRGNGQISPITESATIALRNPKMKAVRYDEKKEIMNYRLPTGSEAAIGLTNGSYMAYDGLDLTDISALVVSVFTSEQTAGGKLELRTDSPTGSLVGEADVKVGTMGPVKIPFKAPMTGTHNLYVVFVNPNSGGKPIMAVDALTFEPTGM